MQTCYQQQQRNSTASITTTESITELKTLTETTNAYTIEISSADATANAADLSTIDGKTKATVDAALVTTISGTYDQITTLYESNGVTGLGNESINLNENLTVIQANVIDGLTQGVVTAAIDPSETVDSLQTLQESMHTIVISSADATGSTASEFNTINGLTTGTIDTTAVTSLAHDSISNINTLLTAGNDTPSLLTPHSLNVLFPLRCNPIPNNSDLTAFFSAENGYSTTAQQEAGATKHYDDYGIKEERHDGSIDVSVLNSAIAAANTATGTTAETASNEGQITTVFSITSGSTIN